MLKKTKKLLKKIPGVRNVHAGIYKVLIKPTRKAFFWVRGGTRYKHSYYNKSLITALEGCSNSSDISDHLGFIFYFTLESKPKLIVELGTRGGESTRVLLSAAHISNANVLSIDIEDCKELDLPYRNHWNFIMADDVEFGKNKFTNWCLCRNINPKIDVLFIDTSHEYDHTKKEIETWSNYLAENGIMIFHDTNMGEGFFSRTDGSVGNGWGNKRGVIKAIEEFLGRKYNEKSFFTIIKIIFLSCISHIAMV